MEGFVKGSFLSVITFFIIACLLIVGLPWLWNWIVFIFQSPLSAGQASKAYLIDSFMECLPFILTTILILLSLDVVINRRYPTVEDEVEMFAGSKIYSPTLTNSSQNLSHSPPTEPKESATNDRVGESGNKLVEMWVDDPEGTGATKEIVERYSPRWHELIKKQGREYEHKPFVKKTNKEIFMSSKKEEAYND